MSQAAPTSPAPSAGTWSAEELATLAAVAETFVRGAATRRASLASAVLDLAADPEQVRQLRLVLRLFEQPLVNLGLGAGPARFRDLDQAARERYLLAWSTSRFAQRRSAYQALRKLLCFLAYADPGEPGITNPKWARIGYRPDVAPLTSQPTPIEPLSPPPGSDDVSLEADVVVVGSGAGAGVVARELAAAGRAVLILEAGAFVPEPAMPADEMAAFDRLYLDHGLASTWDGSVSILAGSVVGGGTTVNWMTCLAAPDEVRREWADEHGVAGFDGPQGDADYAAIRSELGVTPSPALPAKDAALVAGAQALGIEAAPTERNAVSCTSCGSCPFGCRAGTKGSGLRAHLADATLRGARLVAGARVERVLLEGGRAVGVEATLTEEPAGGGATTARRLTVRARQVVVAAGALRSPAILIRSGIRHPAIGRNLRLHPVPLVAGRFAQPIDMWSGVMQAARSTAFMAGESGRNGYVIESAPGHPGLIALAFSWEGADAHSSLMTRIGNFAPLIAITRDGGDGRVTITRSGSVRVDYRLDATGVATLRHALVQMARMSRAAGALEIVAMGTPPVWHGPQVFGPAGEGRSFATYEERLNAFDFAPNRGSIFSAHQMGTVRLGADPRLHPCDPGGRVRSGTTNQVVGGLYVADASLFPTALGANPMLTVMALARRVARTVVGEASPS
ncbi:MAG TPA: GMC family oxidoreductase [Candidatus Limnocylindrales bacterium]|nr:GMC family oxidoreductase [Candidatus Limnocylindrales bacterium]